MSLRYGKAQRSDSERLNELFVEMLKAIYHTGQADGYPEGYLDRFFAGTDEWICTAIENDTVVAFLSIEVHHERGEYIYLDDLSVTSAYRNQGIGTSLIGRAEDYAKEIGMTAVYLHVEKTNIRAYRLYRRLGYTIHEEQENRYLMVKKI